MARLVITLLLGFGVIGPSAGFVQAQTGPVDEADLRIEAIVVQITNPSPDVAVNARIEDLIRRSLQIYPSGRVSRPTIELGLSRARRQGPLADAAYVISPGSTGGVIITVQATLPDGRATAAARGFVLTRIPGDLPVLYDKDGTFITTTFEAMSMFYANDNAWYGRPDLFLPGNPLVVGNPAGAGVTNWAESFIHAGLYGITPLGGNVNLYGGISGIVSASVGQELFTDESRTYFGIEDAYIGLVGGQTSENGDRLVWNLTFGRKRYAIGDGFLIANTASNGGARAALQTNPRWAADLLALAQLRVNTTLVEAFYLDPDELPEIDSKTVIVGVNSQATVSSALTLGGAILSVPESTYGYFTTEDAFSREGLMVYDARLQWQPNPAGMPGPFLWAEAALQNNRNFAMRATGLTAELGYALADAVWSPTVSYRLALFSGDDPATTTFERWDPLLSGGNGEQWVQGINHFKLFQDSNLIAHRLQLRMRPTPKIEIVPQFWLFQADSLTNLGGNPGLSFLASNAVGSEANLTAKWFASPNVLVQGSVAATFAGDGVQDTVSASLDPWLSASVFVRVAF